MALELALGYVPEIENQNLRRSQVLAQVFGEVGRLFGEEYRDFCEKCCATDPDQRASLEKLFREPFLEDGANMK